jgi:hypothetical protein
LDEERQQEAQRLVSALERQRDNQAFIFSLMREALEEIQLSLRAWDRDRHDPRLNALVKEGSWRSSCERALSALVSLWQRTYFRDNYSVKVRATLYKYDCNSLHPVARWPQTNPVAITVWAVPDGLAGIAFSNAKLIVSYDLQDERACGDFVTRTPLQERLKSMMVAPLFSGPKLTSSVIGVLCIDATAALPSWSEPRWAANPVVPAHIFAPELAFLLHAR